MQFHYRYYGESRVVDDSATTAISFAPDTLRKPVHFVADIGRHLPFREAISALHSVVVSDLRTRTRDTSEYQAWLRSQEGVLLAQFMARSGELRGRAATVKAELEAVQQQKQALLDPFWRARRQYFEHLYQSDRSLWIVLDPVITVHPDRVFFECFSRDESTYGSLSCSHEVFSRLGDFSCGTTNIDYSAALYDEFQKIRDYKTTRLAIEPGGFAVQTGDDPGFVEHKIDVPDSWVRGFLQVSAAMAQPGRRLSLHPMDLHNFCLLLRRRKEKVGPRSIRFVLEPGRPVKAVFEPWGTEVVCPRSSHDAAEPETIRIWGRRRLLTLERLIPLAERVEVHLLGTGLPSFWMVEGSDLRFTLGLSGWTANDWSRSGQFDLFGPRQHADAATREQVYATLARHWRMTPQQLGAEAGLDPVLAESCLLLFAEAGRVVYDLGDRVYRLRELSREPLPLDRLRFANEREAAASELVAGGAVSGLTLSDSNGGQVIAAEVKDRRSYRVRLVIDGDERLVEAECQCDDFIRHRLYRGPCAHMLAARLLAQRRTRLQKTVAEAANG
ncbi:SWIM zinc finger family protein [Chitinimonas lacunae]|uniref:SWIM zinc finger family protein n=1 Tax=Chitinimonas lacunae TaxID=1963018 RepID=A0ABV8MJN4_9NEIS